MKWFLGKMQVGEDDPGKEAEQNRKCMTSESVQGIRVCLLMQGTWVQSLLQEDLTSLGATKPLGSNCWACALEPRSHNCWSLHALEPQQEKPPQWEAQATQLKSSPCSLQLEKSLSGRGDPAQPKIRKYQGEGWGRVGSVMSQPIQRSWKSGRAIWVARGISPLTRGRGGARPQPSQLGCLASVAGKVLLPRWKNSTLLSPGSPRRCMKAC